MDLVHGLLRPVGLGLLSPGCQNSQNPKTQLAFPCLLWACLFLEVGTRGRKKEVRSAEVLTIPKASVGAESPPTKVV